MLPRFFEQLLQQEVRAVRALGLDDSSQCIEPLPGLLGIDVQGGGGIGGGGYVGHDTVSCLGIGALRSLAQIDYFSNSDYCFHIVE